MSYGPKNKAVRRGRGSLTADPLPASSRSRVSCEKHRRVSPGLPERWGDAG